MMLCQMNTYCPLYARPVAESTHITDSIEGAIVCNTDRQAAARDQWSDNVLIIDRRVLCLFRLATRNIVLLFE